MIQQIPDTIDDLDLSIIHLQPQELQGRRAQCEMTASVAHIRLGRLVSNILQSLYGLKSCREEELLRRATDIRLELEQWTSALPAYLNPAQVDPCLLQPLWQRQSTMLTVAISHARILAFRPFLIETRTPDAAVKSLSTELANECINAALTAVSVVEDLAKRSEFKASFWVMSPSHSSSWDIRLLTQVHSIRGVHCCGGAIYVFYTSTSRTGSCWLGALQGRGVLCRAPTSYRPSAKSSEPICLCDRCTTHRGDCLNPS
jgi:hypothetical protein